MSSISTNAISGGGTPSNSGSGGPTRPARPRTFGDDRPLEPILRRSQRQDQMFTILGWVLLVATMLVLGALLFDLARDGLSRIDWSFLTSPPSRRAERAGILTAWVGTLLVMLVTFCIAIPLGIAAGVYLEEYAEKNKATAIIEINIANLASVPSIIYGLMALGLFLYKFEDWFGDRHDTTTGLGQSILTAGLTLSLLVLPIVIVATREALRAIPQAIREAAYGLGASRWQVIRQHLLPYSLGGISTGVIIALSRAIGETAPLITVGALAFIAFLPPKPFEPKPWNSESSVPLVVSSNASVAGTQTLARMEEAKDDSRAAPSAPEIHSGTLTIGVRLAATEEAPAGEESRTEIAIQGSESGSPTPLRDWVTALDKIEGLQAKLDERSVLQIVPDAGFEWRTVRDTSGVMHSLGIPDGGGRASPTAWLHSPYTVMPIQMFNWLSRPDPAFLANAAAAGLVLMGATLGMNGIAIGVRARMRRKIKW